MSAFVSVIVDDSQLQAALQRLEHAGTDLAPAMRKITQAMHKVTEDNFAAEGQPKWQPLSDVTKHLRLGGKQAYKKNGQLTAAAQRRQEGGFRILQHTGSLASDISTDYDAHSAVVGSGKEYAAIHQFGGNAGRGRKVAIPARPYLPITPNKDLQPEARQEVLDTVLRHLKNAAGI
ncbi:MAG TPA: phage virion morphogenesis protein [Paucimonas sp.]|nr:phage virion morphogenesis protein [Paucimonas sp.]